ncbi:MAG: lipoyl(octanoyl) transferase LipB [Deltaproteobacteria bacterium]|nr:lipoyl(octanoyl) transferase LipB [Deltaproteobacteria bacterium]
MIEQSAGLVGVIPEWRGRLPYVRAWHLQQEHRRQVIEGEAAEAFWLLEHDPVVTTGRRVVPNLPPEAVLRAGGVDLAHTERGGLATFHGPGQLVGYLILDLRRHRLKVRTLVAGVEEGLMAWLRHHRVASSRRAGLPGVWVGQDKICAVGMHFRRGVSMHGFAVNLTTDLRYFELITPCGIQQGGVTSLERVRGDSPTPRGAASGVANAVLEALARQAVDTPGGGG